METETLRSKRARRASKIATAAAKHDKTISFQPERSEDTAQIDDVELETNSNVQSTQPSRGGYATEILWYRKLVSRASPMFSEILLPRSSRR